MKKSTSKPKKQMRSKNYVKRDKTKEDVVCKPEGAKDSPTNDPAWYSTTPELLRDAASLPFSQAAGTQYNYDASFGGIDYDATDTVPGIMTLMLVPGIGDNSPSTSPMGTTPLNIAANAMYSYVRHANSGSANYDAPDLMMYCLALSQVYAYINYLQRIYGTSQLYSHYNRYLPEALLRAQGANYQDVISHLADFRYGINSLINKAASFACPSEMTYFRRIAFLFSGLYAEGESIKDQLYMYVPAGFFKLNETPSSPGWELDYANLLSGSNILTVQQLIDYGNSLLSPLLYSEDINIMSGDILKAYQGNILKLAPIPEDYVVMPTTDLTVLEQFQNADFNNGVGSVTFSIKVDPDKNLINSSAKLIGTNYAYGAFHQTHLLTTILTNPTPEDVIERTRLMHTAHRPAAESDPSYLITGSEVAVACYLYRINNTPGATSQFASFNVSPIVTVQSSSTPSQLAGNLRMHCYLENFKFHPQIFYVVDKDVAGATSPEYYGAAIDIDNYTMISAQTLDRMNEAALLALFHVPSIARF